MSMEIKNSYNDYKANHFERLKTQQEKAKEAGNTQGPGKEPKKMPVGKDEYISSKRSGEKPSGLYRLGKDENGNPKVLFEDPKKTNPANGNEKPGHAEGDGAPKVKSGGQKDEPEKCIANTDKVDREIKKLKEEKKQLEQQIQRASGDKKEVKQLERKLSQVESELSQKDNDNYRRQNATVTQE